MRETFEFRIQNEYAHLLLKPDEGKRNASNTVIHITRDDPKFERIKFFQTEIRRKKNDFFFLYSNITRKYSRRELEQAALFQVKIKSMFEPAGEECGTRYDESTACDICGINRTQIGLLKLKKSTIPQKDIARTIAGEVVVSENFVKIFHQRNLDGIEFFPVEGVSGYYQIMSTTPIELSEYTVAGINIFDLSCSNGGEIYTCPRGHTIGLNLLSEAYVIDNPSISKYDFFASRQKIGVRRGMLLPESIYFCSPAFRRMIEEEKLQGFDFEITRIVYPENI